MVEPIQARVSLSFFYYYQQWKTNIDALGIYILYKSWLRITIDLMSCLGLTTILRTMYRTFFYYSVPFMQSQLCTFIHFWTCTSYTSISKHLKDSNRRNLTSIHHSKYESIKKSSYGKKHRICIILIESKALFLEKYIAWICFIIIFRLFLRHKPRCRKNIGFQKIYIKNQCNTKKT